MLLFRVLLISLIEMYTLFLTLLQGLVRRLLNLHRHQNFLENHSSIHISPQ